MEKQYIDMMKTYAADHDVPIIEDEGLDIITDLIKQNNVKNILEIGSAISYSAQMMSLVNDCNVVTIERDEKMCKMANYFLDLTKNTNVELIEGDALLIDFETDKRFDLLYIDAAKGQYQKFFDKYKHFVNEDGIIVFDNLSFHGYADMELSEIKSRNLRQLMRKLKEFKQFLVTQTEYEFTFIEAGDGIGICQKRSLDV